MPLRLPKCKHVFGNNCIKKWLETSDSCPYCRDKLDAEPRYHASSSEMSNLLQIANGQDDDGDDNDELSHGSENARQRRPRDRQHDRQHGRSSRPNMLRHFMVHGSSPPASGRPVAVGERRAAPPVDSDEETRRRVRPRHDSFQSSPSPVSLLPGTNSILNPGSSGSSSGPARMATGLPSPSAPHSLPLSRNTQALEPRTTPAVHGTNPLSPSQPANPGTILGFQQSQAPAPLSASGPAPPSAPAQVPSTGSIHTTTTAPGGPFYPTSTFNPHRHGSLHHAPHTAQPMGSLASHTRPHVLPPPTMLSSTTSSLSSSAGRLIYPTPFNQQLPPIPMSGQSFHSSTTTHMQLSPTVTISGTMDFNMSIHPPVYHGNTSPTQGSGVPAGSSPPH